MKISNSLYYVIYTQPTVECVGGWDFSHNGREEEEEKEKIFSCEHWWYTKRKEENAKRTTRQVFKSNSTLHWSAVVFTQAC